MNSPASHPSPAAPKNDEQPDLFRYDVRNAADLPSPALLVYPDRIAHNIQRMIDRVAGEPGRLRPHVKTHKMTEVVRMQIDAGITKFKAATIAEAEMTAAAGGLDVLLAYQCVGPNIDRLARLVTTFPDTSFAALIDDADALAAVADRFAKFDPPLRLFLDIDCGMHRTGSAPGEKMIALAREIHAQPGLAFAGLHVYDGHIHDAGLDERRAHAGAAFAPVDRLIARLAEAGLTPSVLVGGGSPTFPVHAASETRAAEAPVRECSPGTTLFWDACYSENFPDLDFQIAAALLTRVISKPGPGLLCLDIGHKAVASENPPERRVRLPALPDAEPVVHSEEHLVIRIAESAAEACPVGTVFYALPWHICPTVALHAEARVVDPEGRAGETWRVIARDRRITI